MTFFCFYLIDYFLFCLKNLCEKIKATESLIEDYKNKLSEIEESKNEEEVRTNERIY